MNKYNRIMMDLLKAIFDGVKTMFTTSTHGNSLSIQVTNDLLTLVKVVRVKYKNNFKIIISL